MNKPIILLGSAASGKTRYAEAIMACYAKPKRVNIHDMYTTDIKHLTSHDCLVIEGVNPITLRDIYHHMVPYSTDLVFVMQDTEIESDTYAIVNL